MWKNIEVLKVLQHLVKSLQHLENIWIFKLQKFFKGLILM